jgi:hypothetical protein
VASVGVFANASTDLGRAYQQAYYRLGQSGYLENYTTKTIYLWSQLDCLFGSCRGGVQYYPSNLTSETTPKADRALYPITLYIPTDSNGNTLPNQFMTDPGVPEIPGIPGVPGIPEGPPRQIVLDRFGLGDSSYFPGFIKSLIGFVKDIGKSISEFGQNAENAINKIGDSIKSLEANLSGLNYTKPITDGIEDGINLLSNVKNILDNSQQGPKGSDGRYTLPPNSIGTKNNPLQNRVSSSTQEYLLKGYDPKIDGSIGEHLQRRTSTGILDGGHLGAKGTHNNINGKPYIDEKGNIHIPDTYGFGPSEDIYNKPIVKQTVDIIGGIAGALGGENAQKEVSENIQTFFDQAGFGAILGAPGKDAPIVHFETIIPASKAEKLAPGYKNQPVKEESLFEKFNRKEKDANTDNKIKLMLEQINNLPNPIKKQLLLEFKISIKLLSLSPDERLYREKEIKNELLVQTSNLYVDTHFPENQKLFKKLQQSIKRNIKLTDPKTFKNVKDTPSFKKLLSVDYVNKTELPKKKIKLQNRNKKTAARFIKKPRIKSAMELIDEKIIALNNEMKKTGMDT